MRLELLFGALWLNFLAYGSGPAGEGLSQSATSPAPLIGGTLDTGDPAVVSLRLRDTSRCTGSLIGPRTVLTAAHCAVPEAALPLLSVQIEVGSEVAPVVRSVVSQHPHPLWTSGVPRHDIMLLELSADVTEVTPLLLYPQVLSGSDVGRDLRVVGYGIIEAGTPNGNGVKREATVQVRRLLEFQVQAGATGTQDCEGDSGGPGLMRTRGGELEYVAATVSAGSRNCDAIDSYSRVDVDSSWIVETATTWDAIATCGGDGRCVPDCVPADPDCPAGAAPPPDEGGCNTTVGSMIWLGAIGFLLLLRNKVRPLWRPRRDPQSR